MTSYGRVAICPNCSSTRMARRVRAKPRYRCHKCGSTFEIPAYRAPKQKRQKQEHEALT